MKRQTLTLCLFLTFCFQILNCLVLISSNSTTNTTVWNENFTNIVPDLDYDDFESTANGQQSSNRYNRQTVVRGNTLPYYSYPSHQQPSTALTLYRPGQCQPNSCLNDGKCHFNPNTYESFCRCPPKYVGSSCQYQNPCYGNNRCFNGGTCQPIISPNQPPSFNCTCPLGFSASMCEVEVPNICQREHPCHNGGRCQLTTDLEHYHCNCISGWRGELCEERDSCASSPCKNGASCVSHSNGTGYTCECAPGFRGKTCIEDINECVELGDDVACNQKGRCTNIPGSYVCTCDVGYTGKRCETVYIPCHTDNPCQNGGDCIADYQTKTYRCNCPVGFTGRDCEVNIDDCGGHLCQNGGACIDDINTYTCSCPSNFTGPYCSQDVDECSLQPQPCQNGATCANTIGGFNCICVNGWTGPTCSENIDDCANAPCFNGATCHDRVGSYYCQCPPGKTGLLCHLDDACASNPCHAGAICDTSPVDGTYVCSCPTGYKGTDCMQDIDECHDSGSPCEHGGTCVNTPGSYRCDCAIGFAGARCEVNINECDSNPCQNEGTCLDERGSYRCVCMPGYTGVHCESNIDECQSNPCQNNAICTDLINGYRCLCMFGFDGINCEKSIDQCYKNPCKNNGTCHNEILVPNRQETSVCTCPEGFNGRYCEYNINDCESNPCFFGKCVDMINSFKCICNPGFTGMLCQSQINECVSNPCMNGGTCVDELTSYKCECPKGVYGVNCQYQNNECWSNPCLNGGTCHDLTGKYYCQCPSGFRGEQCEIVVDQCQSAPCANGGTCYSTGMNSYHCKCPKGFYGPQCITEVPDWSTVMDQCSQVQCQNGGTCINQAPLFAGYSNPPFPFSPFRCQCKPNYSGLYCEIDQKNSIIDQKRRNAWARCPKSDFCYEHFSDSVCNEECNTRDCLFDGFDCRKETTSTPGSNPSSGSNSSSVLFNHSSIHFDQCNHEYNSYCEDNYANGHCDYGCNIAECAWDGLDCEPDPSSTDYLRGELMIDISVPFNQMNTTSISNLPGPVKKLIRMLSILIGSVLRIKEIRENSYHDTKLIMAIDNRKCRKTGQCFENSQEVASFLSVSQNRQASPVKQFLKKSGMQMQFDSIDDVRDTLNPGHQAHNLTYIVIGLMTLLFVGILLGALVSNNKRVRGVTWFPEGFFANQIAPMSRSGRHHAHSNATAAAACGDYTRARSNGGNLMHTNSIRSGCPDGQEMRQFKSRDDLINDDNMKSPCAAAIYEEPSECRSWSSAHYEAFQPHDTMTPPLATPSIDAIGPNGMTPLMVASAFPNLMNVDNPDIICDKNNAVHDLLMNGANVSLTCDKTNETSLHLAARYARADAAKRLIEGGADCNAQDATGRTPLHAAIAADARGVFEILLRNRTVNLDMKTHDGTTPLILAARMANEGMLEQLVMHQCDLNAVDEMGRTALHWAASVNNVEAIKVLLQHGVDRDARNNREETPLFLAAREGAYQCVKLLLDYHANRDITDNMDQLPRDVALARMHTDIVDLLDKHEQSPFPLAYQTTSLLNCGSNSNSSSGTAGTSATNALSPTSNNSNITNNNNNNNNRMMMVASPVPSNWGTLGRNTTRRKQQQLQQQANGGTNLINHSNLNLSTSGTNANGTLKSNKKQKSQTTATKTEQPQNSDLISTTNGPPLPPPRNYFYNNSGEQPINSQTLPRNTGTGIIGTMSNSTGVLSPGSDIEVKMLLGGQQAQTYHQHQHSISGTSTTNGTYHHQNDVAAFFHGHQASYSGGTNYINNNSNQSTSPSNTTATNIQQTIQNNHAAATLMGGGALHHQHHPNLHQHQQATSPPIFYDLNTNSINSGNNNSTTSTNICTPTDISSTNNNNSLTAQQSSMMMATQSSIMVSPPFVYNSSSSSHNLTSTNGGNNNSDFGQLLSNKQPSQTSQHRPHPVAVAPRHPTHPHNHHHHQHQQLHQSGVGSQPPTPTATTAPASLQSNSVPYQNNQTMLRGAQQQQQQQQLQQVQPQAQSLLPQPLMPTPTPITTMMQQKQQHLQTLDSYPTPSPDSWGSNSSPLSTTDWTITDVNHGGALMNAQAGPQPGQTLTSGHHQTILANGMMMSPTAYSNNSVPGTTANQITAGNVPAMTQLPPQQQPTTQPPPQQQPLMPQQTSGVNGNSQQQQQQTYSNNNQPRFQPSSTQQAVFI